MALLNSWIVVPLIVVLFYSLVLFVSLWKSRAVKSASAHVLAGRSLGVFSIFFLGVAEYYSAASFLGMPGWAYQYGVPAFVLLMSPPLLWSFVYWLGPLIQEAGKQWGCLTQAQFFAVRFGSPALGGLAAAIAVI